MTCEFNSTVRCLMPFSPAPPSFASLFFFPYMSSFFRISFCDPRCSTRLRRRWRREGGNGGTQARRARYTSTGWWSSGGRGDAPLAKTGCTRSPTAVYGSSYLSILLLPPPSLECGGISIILVGNLVWLSSYPLPPPLSRGSKGSIQGTVGAQS